MAVEMNATVNMRYEINHGLLVLQVTPDGDIPPFKAGQYAVLGLPGSARRTTLADPEDSPPDADKIIKRAYSITSSSLRTGALEFYVALVRTGALTPRLFAVEAGDRIWIGKKIVGMFTMDDVSATNDVVFVATGTGLAPYLSMLRSAYRFDSERTTVVCHASRVSWDLGYRPELEGMAERFENFHYLPIIDETDRDPAWQGRTGFVNSFFTDGTIAEILGHDLDNERTSVFLCGNPLMIEGMETMLIDRGFTVHSRKVPGNIIVEKYWAG